MANRRWLSATSVRCGIWKPEVSILLDFSKNKAMSIVMNFKERISLITHGCASIGVVETFKALARYALRAKMDDSNYDKRNFTDTAVRISSEELAMSDATAQSYATGYRTVSERFIRYLISHLEINYREYDFVDIGCGKGRVLLVASDFPFRSICGIELSRPAFEIAEKNIRTYRSVHQKCFNIQIRNIDARCFEPNIGNTVFYFFEPFDKIILTAVLTKLSSKLRGQGKIIYVVCIWSDLTSVLELFQRLGFQAIRIRRMVISYLNYAIFAF